MTPGRITPQGSGRLAARHAGASGFYRAVNGQFLSSLGLGTYLGDTTPAADEAYTSAVHAAVLGGINVLDTAINYRHMRSERNIGTALRMLFDSGAAQRDELLVCTKAGFLTPGAIPSTLDAGEVVAKMHCLAPAFLADQIQRSRANLQLETLDVFYLHNPETQLRFITPDQFDQRILAAFRQLEELCAAGAIAHYGIATWNGLRLKPGHPERLDLSRLLALSEQAAGAQHHFRFVQLPVNIMLPEAFTLPYDTIDGENVNVLEVALRHGLTIVASASLMQAKLSAGLPAELRARFRGPATDSQFAIQFTRSTPGVSVALTGMSSLEHVRENLGVSQFPPASLESYLSLYRRED
jgi:aryl-alcohol dehydrogenase-like predicted oxidoreductase